MIQVGRILRNISHPVSSSMSAVRSDQVAQGFLQSNLENNQRRSAKSLPSGYFFTSKRQREPDNFGKVGVLDNGHLPRNKSKSKWC